MTLTMHVITNRVGNGKRPHWAFKRAMLGLVGLLTCEPLARGGASSAEHGAYRVTGELSVRSIDEAAAARGIFVPTSPPAWLYVFDIMVDGCSWYIHATPTLQPPPLDDLGLPGGSVTPPLDWELVMASDGKEFCRFKAGPRRTPASAYEAHRGSGGAPFGVERELAVLWYAYASRCEVSAGQKSVVPMETLSVKTFASSSNRIAGRMEVMESNPQLPRTVITSGYSRGSELRPVATQGDFTNAIYRVLETTNTGGLTLPLEASVQYFDVVNSGGKVSSKPSYVMELRTHTVSAAGSTPTYPPELKGNYIVNDYRFIDARGAGSGKIISSNGWPGEMVVRSQLVNEPALKKGTWLYPLRLFLIVTVILVPAFCLFAAGRKNNTISKESKYEEKI